MRTVCGSGDGSPGLRAADSQSPVKLRSHLMIDGKKRLNSIGELAIRAKSQRSPAGADRRAAGNRDDDGVHIARHDIAGTSASG